MFNLVLLKWRLISIQILYHLLFYLIQGYYSRLSFHYLLKQVMDKSFPMKMLLKVLVPILWNMILVWVLLVDSVNYWYLLLKQKNPNIKRVFNGYKIFYGIPNLHRKGKERDMNDDMLFFFNEVSLLTIL